MPPLHQSARSRPAVGSHAEHILTGVLDYVPEAVVLTDVRGTAVVASAAAEELFAVRRGFFVRRPLINVVARQDTRSFRRLVSEIGRASAGTTRTQAIRMRSRSGPVFVVSIRVTRLAAACNVSLHWTLCPVSAVKVSQRPSSPPRGHMEAGEDS